MNTFSAGRTALFIDGPNLYAVTRKLGFDVDFRRLLGAFHEPGYLVRAYYYTAVSAADEFHAVRPLIDWLEYNGYALVTKPVKSFEGEDGGRKLKGNMKVEIAVDALRLAPHLDHLVLFSGDGEFTYLVRALKDLGKRVSVVSTLNAGTGSGIADELRREADVFLDLGDLEKEIGRR